MNERLDRIGAEYWEHELEREPTTALLLGDHRFDDRFEDGSRAGEDAAIESLRRFAADAAAIKLR